MRDFAYFAPSTIEQACEILQERGDGAKLLAGGQSLIPVMKMGLSEISFIVDLKRVADLTYIREDKNEIAIGALTTHSEIAKSELLRSALPLLAETASKIGHTQIRNRGTIGGSICHADPAADLPTTAVALNAMMVLQGAKNSQRQVRAGQFFRGVFETALEKGEVLREIRFEIPKGASSAFLKLTSPIGGFALVVVSCLLWVDAGYCKKASIAIGGVTETPFKAIKSEEYLSGYTLDDTRIANAADKSLEQISIMQGLGYSQEFVERIIKVQTKRVLHRALARSEKGE